VLHDSLVLQLVFCISLDMRVAHICEAFVPGGIESLVLDLCVAMPPVSTQSSIFFLYGEDGISQMNNLTSAFPIHMKRSIRIDPFGLLRIRNALRRWNADVLHCHGYYAVTTSLLLRATGLSRPIVYTIHAGIYRGNHRSDRLVQWAMETSDRVVAVSPRTAASVEEFSGGIVRPHVILNGVDVARLKLPPGFNAETKREALGMTSGALLIVAVARFTTEKDHPTLLQAFSEALPQLGNAYLLLVGDGHMQGRLEEMCGDLGLRERVVFLGRRRDVYEILCVSDIFVLSSNHEGLPISVLEACCAGIPVIATEVGGLPDVRDAGLNLILTKKQNVDSLRDALLSLIDPVRRQLLGEELRERVTQLFSIESTADSYLSLYRELTGERERRAA
jgi:glycosyltransferase involved in cell wall biosynthesis